MSSLYRKWRSRSFDDLVGQEPIVRTLRNAVQQGRVAHAYLFTGPRGTGKTSMARILAKAVNCLHPKDGNPCNECEMCRAADENRAMDVIEIDAASNTSVDNVRDLRERVAYAAGEGQHKVYIVDEVHRLSGAAFDAFLKTLEEPPPHVIFVFASTEPHKVPATITSRCQRFDFRRISPRETASRLRYVAREENIDIAEEALDLLSQSGNGSLRDALGLMEQVASYTEGAIAPSDVRSMLGMADPLLVSKLTDHLLAGAIGAGLAEMTEFVNAGGDPVQLTRQFVDYWRALLLHVSSSSLSGSVDPALAAHLPGHAAQLQAAQVVAVIQAMLGNELSAKYNVPPQLPFELGYVQAGLVSKPIPTRTNHTVQSTDNGAQPSSTSEIESPSRVAENRPPVEPVGSAAREPDPPASPADPPPLQSAGTPLTASGVESAWPTIVANMRSRSPSLQAVLRSAYFVKSEDGEITIGFEFDFHRNVFVDVKKRRLLEEVVGEVLGVPYRVKCVRTTKEEIQALRGPGVVQEDDGFVEEVVERLREFHVKQLGTADS